ncbi:Regulatory protein DegR [Bienertia sinuspersici]
MSGADPLDFSIIWMVLEVVEYMWGQDKSDNALIRLRNNLKSLKLILKKLYTQDFSNLEEKIGIARKGLNEVQDKQIS